jgi:hypothetical protein
MTKFGKAEKTGCSGFLFRIVQFWQFQVKTTEGAKLEYLKIQCVLRHGKGLRNIKEPRWKKSKPKAEAIKTGWSDFLRTYRVQLGLRFSLFRKDLPLYESKSYVLLPI